MNLLQFSRLIKNQDNRPYLQRTEWEFDDSVCQDVLSEYRAHLLQPLKLKLRHFVVILFVQSIYVCVGNGEFVCKIATVKFWERKINKWIYLFINWVTLFCLYSQNFGVSFSAISSCINFYALLLIYRSFEGNTRMRLRWSITTPVYHSYHLDFTRSSHVDHT